MATLLRPKVLPEVLGAANVDGIQTTMLVTHNGNLMGYSGVHSQQEAIKIGAIACNVWHSHSTPADTFADAGTLRCLIIDLELGRLVVSPTTDHLVVCHAAPDAPIGMVKAKAQAVALHLQQPLSQITRG
ncbi:hypothetical protein T492DRAFT_1083953 [Pavlovales sp. CCMP2436]|nr:hypothetical protein T492DRAFT_1083953 [Pavlovales sp. CCMP2436]|mmetsp:Transcript_36914/g.91893  ORF Transcript_36914/g.91893 Transcript_36914/m.91893 type:complete len:130 (-) Transcript_36914:52-441(-)